MKLEPVFKICKYCGSYYSPEGTWVKIDGEWICKNCYAEHQDEIPTQSLHYHKDKPKKIHLFK